MNHMEFAEMESRALGKSGWEIWAEKVENILGFSLDGDQEKDGYSMDFACDAWNAGKSPHEYVKSIKFSSKFKGQGK